MRKFPRKLNKKVSKRDKKIREPIQQILDLLGIPGKEN